MSSDAPLTFLSPTANYFDILGVGASVEAETLTRRFHELLRRYHPDRFAAASPALQAEALTSSALVNDAYRTLQDPFLRAEYLLRHERGVRPGEATGAPPQALFVRVMELQEALASYQEARDGHDEAAVASWRPALEEARFDLQGEYEALKSQLTRWFVRYDAGEREAALDGIAAVASVRGYLRRLLNRLAEVL